MHRLRIGLLACGMLISAAPVVGQTVQPAQDQQQVVAQELLGNLVPPVDSRFRTPKLTASQLRALQRRAAPVQVAGAGKLPDLTGEAQAKRRIVLQNAQSNTICYAMRSYQMERVGTELDATTLKSYSSCEAASAFQAKNAIGAAVLVR